VSHFFDLNVANSGRNCSTDTGGEVHAGLSELGTDGQYLAASDRIKVCNGIKVPVWDKSTCMGPGDFQKSSNSFELIDRSLTDYSEHLVRKIRGRSECASTADSR